MPQPPPGLRAARSAPPSISTSQATLASERGSPPDASTLAPGLRLLPAGVRADVYGLYGVLRTLDDLVDDDEPEAPARIEAVERWAREEEADSPETRTLTELCSRTKLERANLATFCAGMRHDIARATIETEADLELYCERAGGSVGVGANANALGGGSNSSVSLQPVSVTR